VRGPLHREFRDDRAVVTALLTHLGLSPLSVKRLAGHAAGRVLKVAAGGKPGDLRLFRTLEALAIGVQGKRCMWRAAQVIPPPLRAPGPRSFVELESRAVDQWGGNRTKSPVTRAANVRRLTQRLSDYAGSCSRTVANPNSPATATGVCTQDRKDRAVRNVIE